MENSTAVTKRQSEQEKEKKNQTPDSIGVTLLIKQPADQKLWC